MDTRATCYSAMDTQQHICRVLRSLKNTSIVNFLKEVAQHKIEPKVRGNTRFRIHMHKITITSHTRVFSGEIEHTHLYAVSYFGLFTVLEVYRFCEKLLFTKKEYGAMNLFIYLYIFNHFISSSDVPFCAVSVHTIASIM
jgi:hypothetical protein